MRYFLVDTENISQYDFIEEFNLTNKDTIILFISDNSNNVRLKDLVNITTRNIVIEDEYIYTGTENALDFQLIAKLSILICNLDRGTEFFVISNDNGFEAPVRYLKEKMSANIEIIKVKPNEIALDMDNLNINSENEFDRVTMEVINNSETLSELHNNLRALHGNEKGRELYLKVKKGFKK